MVILSQDKKRMFNFENLVEIRVFAHNNYPLKDNVKGYDLQGVTQNGKYIILGIYDTEERAKEVLEEIIKAYLDCNEQNVLAEYAYVKNKVYEMPTE